MTKKNSIYYPSFFTYTLQGMIALSIGLLMPFILDAYSISYSQGGSMIFFLLLGGMMSSTAGGMLIGKAGEKFVIIVGALCVLFGYGIFLFVENIKIIYILLFFVGIGTGLFNIALNTLVAFVSDSDAKKINSLHMFFAVGALLATIIVASISFFNLNWKIFICIIDAMAFATILMFAKMDIHKHKQDKRDHKLDLSFFKKPYIYIFLALLFFYVGIENAVNGWIVTFLSESKIVSETASNSVLSVLWLLVIIGRLINRRLKKSITLESRIVVTSIIILLSYVLLITTSSVFVLLASVVILGLAMSAFYPNVIANSSEKIKSNSTALGLILSFGGLGGAVIPWINGLVADSKGLQMGMYAVILSIVLLIVAAICNIKTRAENYNNKID
ncbi:MAG: MFS transporter [Eubacteriales bacterium]